LEGHIYEFLVRHPENAKTTKHQREETCKT